MTQVWHMKILLYKDLKPNYFKQIIEKIWTLLIKNSFHDHIKGDIFTLVNNNGLSCTGITIRPP